VNKNVSVFNGSVNLGELGYTPQKDTPSAISQHPTPVDFRPVQRRIRNLGAVLSTALEELGLCVLPARVELPNRKCALVPPGRVRITHQTRVAPRRVERNPLSKTLAIRQLIPCGEWATSRITFYPTRD